MYSSRKGGQPSQPPSDAQAKEKLNLYVYEYLTHAGAKGAAELFLKEINFCKNITLGDPPGFLQSWWCVFWDLYCAAPERRESCDSSQEAKAFHDYGFGPFPPQVNGIHGQPNAAPSPMGMPGGGGEGGLPHGHPAAGLQPGGAPPPGAAPGHPFYAGGPPGAAQVRPVSGTGPVPAPGHPIASQASPHHPPPGAYQPRPGFPPVPGPPGPSRLPPAVRMSQAPEMIPQGAPAGYGGPPGAPGFPGQPQRLPPSGVPPGAAPGGPHPRMPGVPGGPAFPPAALRGPVPPRPGVPWPPSTSTGPMMSNGPGAMPSPSAMAPGSEPESGRFTGGGMPGGPASVEQSASVPPEGLANGADGSSEMKADLKSSPASNHGLNGGGTPGPGGSGSRAGSVGGPGSVPPAASGGNGGGPNNLASESMDYTTNTPGQPGFSQMGGGENPMHYSDSRSEIEKIKERMMEETKHMENSGPQGSSDDFFA